MKEKFRKLIEICEGSHVYIQTHDFPDPDAIGAAFGLQKLMQHFDIKSTLCYYGKIDKLSTNKMTSLLNIEIFPYEEIEKNMRSDDYVICVDSQKNGGNIKDFVGDEIACIDHHPTYVEEKYRYSDIRITGSCSTLITQYFKELEVEMDADTATALLYGLRMDTLQLSRGVTDLDIEMFAYLHSKADTQKMTNLDRNTMEFSDLKSYGSAIENIQLFGTTGFAYIPFACPDALIATIADFILSMEEVDVAIVYSYRENGIKFSTRSEDIRVNIGEVTNKALSGLGNGGGHATMAGGFISKENMTNLGNYPDVRIQEIFLEEIENQLT